MFSFCWICYKEALIQFNGHSVGWIVVSTAFHRLENDPNDLFLYGITYWWLKGDRIQTVFSDNMRHLALTTTYPISMWGVEMLEQRHTLTPLLRREIVFSSMLTRVTWQYSANISHLEQFNQQAMLSCFCWVQPLQYVIPMCDCFDNQIEMTVFFSQWLNCGGCGSIHLSEIEWSATVKRTLNSQNCSYVSFRGGGLLKKKISDLVTRQTTL